MAVARDDVVVGDHLAMVEMIIPVPWSSWSAPSCRTDPRRCSRPDPWRRSTPPRAGCSSRWSGSTRHRPGPGPASPPHPHGRGGVGTGAGPDSFGDRRTRGTADQRRDHRHGDPTPGTTGTRSGRRARRVRPARAPRLRCREGGHRAVANRAREEGRRLATPGPPPPEEPRAGPHQRGEAPGRPSRRGPKLRSGRPWVRRHGERPRRRSVESSLRAPVGVQAWSRRRRP